MTTQKVLPLFSHSIRDVRNIPAFTDTPIIGSIKLLSKDLLQEFKFCGDLSPTLHRRENLGVSIRLVKTTNPDSEAYRLEAKPAVGVNLDRSYKISLKDRLYAALGQGLRRKIFTYGETIKVIESEYFSHCKSDPSSLVKGVHKHFYTHSSFSRPDNETWAVVRQVSDPIHSPELVCSLKRDGLEEHRDIAFPEELSEAPVFRSAIHHILTSMRRGDTIMVDVGDYPDYILSQRLSLILSYIRPSLKDVFRSDHLAEQESEEIDITPPRFLAIKFGEDGILSVEIPSNRWGWDRPYPLILCDTGWPGYDPIAPSLLIDEYNSNRQWG